MTMGEDVNDYFIDDEESQSWERNSAASSPATFAAFARRRQQLQQQQQQQQQPRDDGGGGSDGGGDDGEHDQDQQHAANPRRYYLPEWTTLGGRRSRNRRGRVRVRYATSPPTSMTTTTTTTMTTTRPRRRSLGGKKTSDTTEDDDASDHIKRGLVATPLNAETCQPMSPGARFIHNIRREESILVGDNEGACGGDGGTQMYRLMATRGTRNVGKFWRTLRFFYACVKCGALTESSIEQSTRMSSMADPSRWLTDFFFWLFRKGWATVIVLSIIWYYALVLFFAGLIVWSSKLDHDCIRVGDEELGESGRRLLFMDAFSLSWNTFSTVGYGSSYPALSTQHDNVGDDDCVFILFITSFEALAGVVYAGFTGAIFFAKVTRITQEADVKFSDSLTVRFGLGVELKLVDDDEGASPRVVEEKKPMSPLQRFKNVASSLGKPSPFPVITFRLANTLHNVSGGEIISANLNAAVLTESRRHEHQISNDLARQIGLDRIRRASAAPSLHMLSSHRSLGGGSADEFEAASKIVPRQIFTKLTLETHEHPMFKRIWRINHVINSNSPLLTDEAKKAINANGGVWPWEWNNHKAVRNAIRFNELVVSFTGVSNLTGAPVYKQKVYSYDDTAVGYEFVHTLYRGRNGVLKVDMNLINDVIEQKGGGGEPLDVTAR